MVVTLIDMGAILFVAGIVQTHRDPLKCMASATSLMGTLYSMRSNKPFDARLFENIIMGEATAQRLEHVMAQRDAGIVPEENIVDSRYQDLMDDPLGCIARIYAHFGMPLEADTRERMWRYLADKPKGKFGAHSYAIQEHHLKERQLFAHYQARYAVPDEV